MWPSEEFNTRRWMQAQATSRLLLYPAVRTDNAPSVLVTSTSQRPVKIDTSIIDKATEAGNIQWLDLGGDFTAWSNGTKEGKIEITAAAGHKELCWQVRIEHKTDGGEGGQYPVGWPRISRSFRDDELDFTDYDYLSLLIRVDSNRDEVVDDLTRVGLSLHSNGTPKRLYEIRVDLGDRQRQWIPLRFSLSELIDRAGVGLEPWRSISNVQLFVAESDYSHGTDLTFQIKDITLLRFTSPTIQHVYAPVYVTLPRNRLAISFDVIGTRRVRKDSHTITTSLTSGDGRTRPEQQQDLTEGRVVILDTSTLIPGRYSMDLKIVAADCTRCANKMQLIEAIDGPLVYP
jgi:hypothetical protein